jgi:hypothetical protein
MTNEEMDEELEIWWEVIEEIEQEDEEELELWMDIIIEMEEN